MKIFFVCIFFIGTVLFAEDIDTLLQELESNTQKSLNTVDEKLGHVTIYSQKDLRLMQYSTISDLLKELPFSTLNRNRFGTSALSLSGTKTDVGGFFRIFINDHEVSSNYTQSIPETWMEFPMDIVDYVEIYRGDSSFSMGGGNGVFFIRIYTKKPCKENTTQFVGRVKERGSNLESLAYSDTFENGWSTLAFVANQDINYEESYKSNTIKNDSNKQYVFFNAIKNTTSINAGYARAKKDDYFGFSLDANPDEGEMKWED